mgnify:FL=1
MPKEHFLILVGEEDEVSIKEVAEMVVEAMDFKGGLEVSFHLADHHLVPLHTVVKQIMEISSKINFTWCG